MANNEEKILSKKDLVEIVRDFTSNWIYSDKERQDLDDILKLFYEIALKKGCSPFIAKSALYEAVDNACVDYYKV